MSEPRVGSPLVSSSPGASPPSSLWRDGRGAFALVLRSPLVLVFLCNLTFILSLMLLQGTGLQGMVFLGSGRTQVWHMLCALPTTAWVISLCILFGDFEHHRSAWPRTRRGWMALALCLPPLLVLVALPLLAQYLAWREDPLVTTALLPHEPNFFPKVLGSSLFGLLTTLLLISGIVGLHLQFLGALPKYQHLGEPTGSTSLDEDVRWYQRRQAQLRRFLLLSSGTLGASILGVSALRHVINALLPPSIAPLPPEPVMGYGLYYTGLMATLYVPTHRTLTEVGRALAERLVWQSLRANPTWKHRLEEQQAISVQLGLQGSALQDLQQGLTVLAPFLASISSLTLDLGG